MNNWSLGINLTILGMGTVFLVLAVLAVAMILLNNFYESLSGKKKAKEDKTMVSAKGNIITNDLPLTTAGNQSTSVKESGVSFTKGISAEVIAVIAASIAVVLEKSPSDIKLTNVRKINDISSGAWIQQGRLNVIGARASFFARKGNRG